MVSSLFGSSREESELSFQGTERLFAAELFAIGFEDEVLQVQKISDGQVGWVIVDVFGKEEDG